MGVAMYLRWLCFLPASLAFDVFGRLLAPIVVLFTDNDGWLPSWLWWWQTPDNSIDGDADHLARWGGVAVEKLRLRLQHQRNRLSPSGQRREGSRRRSFYWRHIGYFGRLPVEGLPGWKAGLLAVLLRKALPNFWSLEVRSYRRRLEDLGPASTGLCLRTTLGVFSPDQGFRPELLIRCRRG